MALVLTATAKVFWLVGSVTILGVSGLLAYFYEPIDGYGGWVLSRLARKEDTAYAPQYSDDGFRRIAVGMTNDDVTKLVGRPLEVYSVSLEGKQCTGWRFSRSANGASYRIRSIVFCEGHVRKIFREFSLD